MDLPLELTKVKHESRLNRDNTTREVTVAEFYLGKFGPFVERFDAAEFSDYALQQRIDTMRRHLESLHRQ